MTCQRRSPSLCFPTRQSMAQQKSLASNPEQYVVHFIVNALHRETSSKLIDVYTFAGFSVVGSIIPESLSSSISPFPNLSS